MGAIVKKTKPPAKFPRAISITKVQTIELLLFVSGITPKSIRAIEVLNDICETYLAGRYDLRIIDIYKQPEVAKINEVFAVPTLVKKSPGPRKIFIGDLADATPVLKTLGIKRKGISNET